MARKARPDFLIVGMERSGTHWVAGLLNAHPEIAAFPSLPFHPEGDGNKIGEVHFFNTLASLEGKGEEVYAKPISDWLTKYNGVFRDLVEDAGKLPKKEFYKKAVTRYSEYCDSQRGNKKIVGEGSPAYIFHLDFIDTLYPGIKKICSIRDPKDKIVSWYMSKMVRKGDVEVPNITSEFALDYLEKRIMKEYEALLNYGGGVHCVTYEKLNKNTAQSALGMVQHLGFDASPEILARMVADASFEKKTAEDSGHRRKSGEEDVKSGLRKGVVGDWKNHISSDLASKIDERVRDLRQRVFEKYKVSYE